MWRETVIGGLEKWRAVWSLRRRCGGGFCEDPIFDFYAALRAYCFIIFRSRTRCTCSSSMSKSSCSPSQNLAVVPKYLDSLSAVSAVILRLQDDFDIEEEQ